MSRRPAERFQLFAVFSSREKWRSTVSELSRIDPKFTPYSVSSSSAPMTMLERSMEHRRGDRNFRSVGSMRMIDVSSMQSVTRLIDSEAHLLRDYTAVLSFSSTRRNALECFEVVSDAVTSAVVDCQAWSQMEEPVPKGIPLNPSHGICLSCVKGRSSRHRL